MYKRNLKNILTKIKLRSKINLEKRYGFSFLTLLENRSILFCCLKSKAQKRISSFICILPYTNKTSSAVLKFLNIDSIILLYRCCKKQLYPHYMKVTT